ncbi:MAG TPA: response regulator transcription factor [Candidatus Acidoferrales bacterium]|nr:response regulator transcription factor [Candidatus Acidoferrales bacterium]
MIRVFIVAASPLSRAGLENLLVARGVEVVGSSAAIEALPDMLADVAPDVILVDSFGEPFEPMMESILASGLAADMSVVILSDGLSPGASAHALRAGIRAALPADLSPDQLVAALQGAASGLFVLHPAHAPEALPASSAPARARDELAESLTRREIEVLQMLAAGLSNKEIAARLNISDHTVKFHVASILGKLGAASRTEAVSLGIRRGLVLL